MNYRERSLNRLRDIKLKILLNEIHLPTINLNLIKKKNIFMNQPHWQYIEKYKHLGLLSGSMVLKAYGLINRDAYDIDIISDKNYLFEYLSDKKTSLQKHGMYSEEGLENSLGFIEDNKYVIDFFESNGKEIYEIDRKSTRLNSSHSDRSRMPSSA